MFAKHENIQIDKLLLNLLQKHTGYLQQLKKKKLSSSDVTQLQTKTITQKKI